MKGGESIDEIEISLGKCGRREKFSFTNPLKKCIVLSYNNRKITINYDAGKIIVKYFNKIDTNIYYKKIDYSVTKTDLLIFSIIIRELLNDQEVFLDQSRFLSLIIRINKFIKEIPNTDLKFSMINGWLDRILLTIPPQPIIPDIKPKPNKYQENLETQRKYQEKLNLIRIDPIIAKEKAENDRQRMIKAIQFIDQMNPNSEQGSALQHRTNWSKQSNYKSFTIQQQNLNQFSNNI